MTAETPINFAPGTPVCVRDVRGFIAGYKPNSSNVARSFMIGGPASMEPIKGEYIVVLSSGTLVEIPDVQTRHYVNDARRYGWPDVLDHEARYSEALAARDKAQEERRQSGLRAQEAARAFKEKAESLMPPGTIAAIVAEQVQDESDSMSDYFHAKTLRTVILAWSTNKRDLFPEMRKAAQHFPETAHLTDAPESAEHREKWSMGAGYYLKAGYRYSSGWQVRKIHLGTRGADGLPVADFCLSPEEKAERRTPPAIVSGSVTIEKHQHTKHGFDMWLVVFPGRLERDDFDRLLSEAKATGGWYSRAWGNTPGGFAFKDERKAQAFAGITPDGDDTPNDTGTPSKPLPGSMSPRPQAGAGDRLRALADTMQGDINSKLGNRLANTPKRKREADSARIDGRRLQRAQQGLRALADMHDAGTVPEALRKVTTKAAAYELAGSFIDRTNSGYYDAGIDTDRPAKDTPEALAFWALLAPRSEADRKADDLRAKVEALQFANIPGYFPTPAPVVARMLDHAKILPGMLILEPSAGSGNILDAIATEHPGARLVAFERHHSLAAILKAKGYTVDCCDFTEREPEPDFDRVLMNPPFEKGQDADHVRIAFAHLKAGGRIVAIMSPGPFFRSDDRARSFRRWFEEIGGEKYDLPAGSFKVSGTDVATVLVVIDKE
jgi:protein-L-isoaspartate O-methyltransferase